MLDHYSPFIEFSRKAWKDLRRSTPMSMTAADTSMLQGLFEAVSLQEIEDIYLPLSELLNFYVSAAQELHQETAEFLGRFKPAVPYLIGITGSVAVGKSAAARILKALLCRWPKQRKVEMVSTDDFLYPNSVLEEKGLMERKGFPETYDLEQLIQFLSDLKAGKPALTAPLYSHRIYDILPGEVQQISQPDIVIVEGLNILQASRKPKGTQVFVSDFFDFTIYMDAKSADIRRWFLNRFELFRKRAKNNESDFFHQFAAWPDAKARVFALKVWKEINERNLVENIQPYRERARLILVKNKDHAVKKVLLRKI